MIHWLLMNKFPVYDIIIRILTCPILWTPVPNYVFSYEKQDGRRHRTIDAITKVRRQLRWIYITDQLSTYIYVYVDNYQNKICFEKLMKLFVSWNDCLPINGKDSICSWRVFTVIAWNSPLAGPRLKKKRNACNNFTKSVWYDALVTYE